MKGAPLLLFSMHCDCLRSNKLGAAVFIALAMGCTSDPRVNGRSGEEWIQLLSAPEVERRVDAANSLGKILETRPDYTKGVKALGFAIGDTSDMVRLAAADALTAQGVDGLAALPGFHAALHDTAHPSVRAATAHFIGALGPHRGLPLVSSLLEATCDSVPEVRLAAINALRSLNAGDRTKGACASP